MQAGTVADACGQCGVWSLEWQEMQDRYAGDVGDYGKFGLLKELQKQGFSIGVNWYKTETSASEKREDGRYNIQESMVFCDPALAAKLIDIYRRKQRRSISALEAENLIEGIRYFNEYVSHQNRNKWHQRALKALSGADLIFLDPDNGMIVPSIKDGNPKIVKYVLYEEVRDYLNHGQSILFYNHRCRIKEPQYFEKLFQRFAEKTGIPKDRIQTISFPRFSVRDYLAISANEEHHVRIQTAFQNMLNGPWGEHGAGLCRESRL